MQRLGRKGHPTYRVVVQDSKQAPNSGKYVAMLGSYDPHTKQSTLVKDKAEFYLKNGAQPSDRVIGLFKSEKVALPNWVNDPTKHERSVRNPEKLRKNRPADAKAVADEPAEEAPAEEPSATEEPSAEPVEATEAPAEETVAEVTEETKAEESEAPEEKASEDELESAETADQPAPESDENKA